MQEISIEIGEVNMIGKCPCCENETQTVNGYVYVDQNARAVYFSRWTNNHLERGIQILLSIGQWGEGTSGSERCRIGFECRMGTERPGFMIVDAASLPWDDEQFLGTALTREEVLMLSDQSKEEMFHILDHLATDDERINNFLFGSGLSQSESDN